MFILGSLIPLIIMYNNIRIQMNENHKADDASFLQDSVHNPLTPIRVDQNFQRNPVFFNKRGDQVKSSNSVITALSNNKATGKLQFSEQFQDFLARDQGNQNLNIVTFLGPRQVGKSFLVDFLVSKEEKSVSRFLSKASKGSINMPTYSIKGKNGQKVIFFDSNEQISNEAFLWAYFLSSVFVLNLPQGDKKGQQQFLAKVDQLRLHLDASAEDLTPPQLVILRRDSTNKQFKEKEFLTKVESSGAFSNDIVTMNMAYPGNSSVTSKDIKDVSESMLNEAFVNDALNLSWVLKAGRPKTIKGNIVGSKIAGLILDPLTSKINNKGKVDTSDIWNNVIQILSVGYYNYFITKYNEQLQKEFKDEEPSDKYTLYKKLSRARRNVQKKVEGFSSIAGDPTFERYRQKLQKIIGDKQKQMKQVNTSKSIRKNDELCKKLFSQMNDSNCEALIQKYCESKLDDNKTQVLLNNFETVIKKRLNDLEKSKAAGSKPTTQIQQLEKELKDLHQKIQNEKKSKVEVIEYDFNKVQANIAQKQKEVADLQKELSRQKDLSNEKKANQNKDITELEKKIQALKSTTKDQQKEIERLKLEKQAQSKKVVQQLNKKLQKEEQTYNKLRAQVDKAQQQANNLRNATTKPAAKDTCCQIM